MPRLLTTILVLLLVTGTAAAFAVTESLKLERSPISRTDVDKVLSPACRCDKAAATIGFSLRKADDLTLVIVDEDDDVVRTVVASERFGRGFHRFRWDGRRDDGRIAEDGDYRPRVHLDDAHRTIVLPNEIRLDTVRPSLTVVSVGPRVFSPDRDKRRDRLIARYRVDEPAHAILYVNGVRRAYKRQQRTEDRIEWWGRVRGRAVRAGRYRITLAAEDRAGNVSLQSRPVWVTVRYVELGRDRIAVRTRARFGVRVVSDAREIRWRLAGRRGVARPGLLVLRAPARAGRYRLFVSANGRAAVASVLVRPRPQ